MAEAPKLRVIDGHGEVVQEDGSVLPADYALIEEQCRVLRRQVSALKGQISRLQKVDPQAAAIERVLMHWKLSLRGPTSRVGIPIDGKRADAIRKMLRKLVENDDDPELANPDKVAHLEAAQAAEARAVERMLAAIDGCARFPFQHYDEQYPDPGPGRKRRDEPDYIFRDEVRLEKFVALSEADDGHAAYRADLWRRLKSRPMLREVLRELGPDPHGETLARAVRWCCANP
jgi:hypothetical protein